MRYIETIQVPVGELDGYPGNPRAHAMGALVESARVNSQYRSIVARRHGDGRLEILAGHGTRKAFADIGAAKVRVEVIECDDDTAARIVLVDNRSNDLAGYDDQALAELLVELAGTEQALSGTGFDQAFLDELLAGLAEEDPGPEPLSDPDDVPEPPADPVTQPGDVWLLGPHRVICGDARDGAVMAAVMAGKRADMVFTDPPYGMNLDVHYDAMHSGKGHRVTGDRFTAVTGDDEPFDAAPFLDLLDDVAEQFWWGADYYRATISDGGSWIVWDKRSNDADMNLDAVHGAAFELCWSRQRHKREIARVLWSGHHGMQREDTKNRVHPTQKPVALARWFFERWGQLGGLVLDPFMGSGSTLLAAHTTGRVAYGCEISPAYCDVICRRFQTAAGIVPVLAATGEAHDFTTPAP